MPSLRAVTKGSSLPDPVAELRFKVEVQGVSIGRFSECTGISVEIEMKDYMEGGSNEFVHKLPGRISFSPITSCSHRTVRSARSLRGS